MYGIFTYIYPINDPNVGKYTIHGASGIYICTQVCRYDYVICISMCNKYTAYHPILQHDNGKSPFSICKSTINGPFSIALRLSVKPAEVLDASD